MPTSNPSLSRRPRNRNSPRIAIASLWIVLLVAACSSSSDEEQVRAVIDAAEVAAESRDTSEVMDLVADDYRDAQGLDKSQLTQYLRGYFLVRPKIEIVTRIGAIEFETANRAKVQVDIAMGGTQLRVGESSSLTGELEALNVELQRRDSKWVVTRVDRVRK